MDNQQQIDEHEAAFYQDIARTQILWTIQDDSGIPVPQDDEGRSLMPFWSSLARVNAQINESTSYKGFALLEISWADFHDKWLPGLANDDLMVGINWHGPDSVGSDLDPADVIEQIEAAILKREAAK